MRQEVESLIPPSDRKFHPSLAKFARDGRFVDTPEGPVIDTLTEKQFDRLWRHSLEAQRFGGYPRFVDYVAVLNKEAVEIRRLPSSDRLDLPPETLELWAQVVVRGELGDDGRFVEWDELTWEHKRQELAAFEPPWPDFPFPAYVATDKLHWLRAEYFAVENDIEKQRLAKELLRRAEANGDNPEAARWRTILTPAVDQEANSVSK